MRDFSRQPPEEPPDRRRFGRRSVFKHGSILDDNSGQAACIVVDISDSGARLKVRNPSDAAERFELVIEEDDFSVRCEIVRREAEHIGVRFTGSPRRLSWQRRPSRIKARVSEIIRKSAE